VVVVVGGGGGGCKDHEGEKEKKLKQKLWKS